MQDIVISVRRDRALVYAYVLPSGFLSSPDALVVDVRVGTGKLLV